MRCSTHIARRRLAAWATAVLVATGIAAGTATAASAEPGPAAGVAPGATAVGSTRYVFYTASDGSVWQKKVGGGTTAVGGVLVSAPSPITLPNGTIRVFGQGSDHALWYADCNAGSFCSGWASLGGVLTSKPGAVQSGAGSTSQSVYARGSDGALWARDNTATGWAPWHLVGGALLAGTGPCAAFRNGSQFVLVTGTDKQLWLDEIGGSGFGPVGGRTTATPALAATSGSLTGYARGTDGALFWKNVSAAGVWESLGGFLTSGCGGTAAAGVPYGYALGGDSQVWENANLSPSGWSQVTF